MRHAGDPLDPGWLTRLKRAGDVATSLHSVIALLVLVVGGIATFLVREVFGDGTSERPVATLAVSGRSEQNVLLVDQLARADNRTQLRATVQPPSDRYGDVHGLAIRFRGHDGPCRITWDVFDADTRSRLAPSQVVEHEQECRSEGNVNNQDVWVENPDDMDAYFVRFVLRDAHGEELARADTSRYELA